jgi:hypothetical protein
MDERTGLAERFEERRPRLRASPIACLLAQRGADAVQEAWLQRSGAAHGKVDTSSDGHVKASPARETLIGPSDDAGTSSRPGTMFRGMVIEPPLRNLRSIASRVGVVWTLGQPTTT